MYKGLVVDEEPAVAVAEETPVLEDAEAVVKNQKKKKKN
jgi:hypothetical protein